MDVIREPFGWKLRRELDRKGMSQKALAVELGKGPREASRLANLITPPSTITLERIAGILKIGVGELLAESEAWQKLTSGVTGADEDRGRITPRLQEPPMPHYDEPGLMIAHHFANLPTTLKADAYNDLMDVVRRYERQRMSPSATDRAEGD